MQVYTSLQDIGVYPAVAVALGTFDGVHRGHQQIIGRAVTLARGSADGTAAVFTFSNHPSTILHPEKPQKLLITQADKEQLIAALGVDVLVAIPFDYSLCTLSPEQFVHDILWTKLKPRHVVVGPNYSFGARAAGTPALLATMGRRYGFAVTVQDAVYVDGVLVSSTAIRRLVAHGDVTAAARLLGRPPHLSGTVITGEGRGRRLGYPTANLAIPSGLVVPRDGVYAVKVKLAFDQWCYGAANIGANPTFGGHQRRLEIYLLDFDGNIYGQTITVQFLARLRGEFTFATEADLIAQMTQDISRVREFIRQEKKSGV